MHERETIMQSGENPAMLVVCVCEAVILHTDTHTPLMNPFHLAWCILFFILQDNCSVCVCVPTSVN